MKVTKKTKNNGGFIVSLELLLISTILVIGLVTGLAAVRDAAVSELQDTAEAIEAIDQSYSYDGKRYHRTPGYNRYDHCSASTAGSVYNDQWDGEIIIHCISPRGEGRGKPQPPRP